MQNLMYVCMYKERGLEIWGGREWETFRRSKYVLKEGTTPPSRQNTWQPCLHVSRAREQGNSLQGLQAPNDV